MQYLESDTLIFVAVVVLVGWILWLHFKRRQQQVELKRMQMHLSTSALQKFGAANEFVAFLQSKEGQTLLSDSEPPEKTRSRTSIRFVQIGILMLFAGIGIFLFVYMYGGTPDREMRETLAVLSFSGTTAISLGIGLFVTAAVTSLWERWSGGHGSSPT